MCLQGDGELGRRWLRLAVRVGVELVETAVMELCLGYMLASPHLWRSNVEAGGKAHQRTRTASSLGGCLVVFEVGC